MSSKFEKLKEELTKYEYGIPFAVDDPVNPTVYLFLTHYTDFELTDGTTIPTKMGRVFHKLNNTLWPTRNIDSALIKGEWYLYDPNKHPGIDEILKNVIPLDTHEDVKHFFNR